MPFDDMGDPFEPRQPPRRVVSLVPSLTEAVALTARHLLVAATQYCTHPADLQVARIGGSKYPSVEQILSLRPDVVLANAEENRRADAQALRAAGVPVWVTYPRTVDGALDSLTRLIEALQVPAPPWLAQAYQAWQGEQVAPWGTAAIVVWRRPWIVASAGTFGSDVLRRLGLVNVFGEPSGDDPAARYTRPSLAQLRERRPDVIVLPDEPYAFHAGDGPEAFDGLRCALVSGRHLTWYGPSLVSARDVLRGQLSA